MIWSPTGRRWTYEVAERAVCQAGYWLQDQGVRAGDRVAIALGNHPWSFQLLLGAARFGAVPLPLDPLLGVEELRGFLRLCGVRLIALNQATRRRLGEENSTCRFAVLPSVEELEKTTVGEPWSSAPASLPMPNVDSNAPAVLAQTSGTTDEPRVVAVTQEGLTSRLEWNASRLDLDHSFVFLSCLPFHFELFYPLLTSYFLGCPLVQCPLFNLKTLAHFWKDVGRYHASTVRLVPSVIKLLLEAKSRFPPRRAPGMRFIVSTSALLEADVIREFKSVFGVPLRNCYGLRETGFIAVSPQNPMEKDFEAVGIVDPEEVSILDSAGRWTPRGCVGRVAFAAKGTRGRPFFFYGRPELDRKSFQGDRYLTGDVGRIGPGNKLYLEGRTIEVINRDGRKIFPEEINRVLLRHSAVLDAASFGVPDPLRGSIVAACVVLKPNANAPDEAELLRHCRRWLTHYKCPSRVRLVRRIPRTALGKLRLVELRRQWKEIGGDLPYVSRP